MSTAGSGSKARQAAQTPRFLKGFNMAETKSNYTVALEVLAGKWGNGVERRNKITAAGYSYDDVQSIVNSLVK